MSDDPPDFEEVVEGTEFETDEVDPFPGIEDPAAPSVDSTNRNREEELLAQIDSRNTRDDPSTNKKLLYFVAAREAGLQRGIDITASSDLYLALIDKLDIVDVGLPLTLSDGSYFDPPDGDHPSLNRTEDWDELKEIVDFDPENWPMESLGDSIEEASDEHD